MNVYSSKKVFMVVHSCLFIGIILVQIHTGILTWNETGIEQWRDYRQAVVIDTPLFSCSFNGIFMQIGCCNFI